ncbi:MAG: hypothetical protein OEW04_04055 [Nitrospirota bacterium]|nr:hypothetical protein [Nitrospirota bacterium]
MQSFSFSLVFHILALTFLFTAARNQQMLPAENWPVQLTLDQGISAAKPSADQVQSPAGQAAREISDAMPAEERVTEPEQPNPVPEASTPEIPPLLRRPEPDMQQAIMRHRSTMSHAKMYILTAGATVTGILEKVLQEKMLPDLDGANAKVMLRYGADGLLTETAVSADSEELKSLLLPVNWRDFPLPLSYSLQLSGLDIEIAFAGPRPKISFVTYF